MTTAEGDVGRAEIAAVLSDLGLSDGVLCVHSSLRSFGTVAGGPDAIIDGVLDVGATLLVPTSSSRFCKAPKPSGLPPIPYNSENDGSIPAQGHVPPAGYRTSATFVEPDMGAVPAALLRRPERRRGDHPLNSFSAIGPAAGRLIEPTTPTDVFAPLTGLVGLGGSVVCMGVGLDTVTLLHLAELNAGLRLLTRWGMYADGSVRSARHGGCSSGFGRLAPVVAPALRQATVGASSWLILDAATLLDVATAAFAADPDAGHCADRDCIRCNDQTAYGRRRTDLR